MQSAVASGSSWRLRGSLADRLEVLLPFLGYLLLALTGATTSSLGLLRQDPSVPLDGQFGSPLPIRSDEWLTTTPIELATLVHGSSMHPQLSQGPDLIYQISSGGFFESILFLDGNLLRLGPWQPDAVLFAAYRGFPWLLLFLALPPLLRRLGATRPMSWLGLALCFLAPASIWWSFMPIRILAFAAAGSYLLFLARDQVVARRWVPAVVLAGLAGLSLARLVTFYVPWSLTVGVPLVAATGAFMLREKADRRVSLVTIGIGAAIGGVVLAGTLWENWGALHAELNTLYPGQRRATGSAELPFQLFGAPGLTELEDDPAPFQMNQSEISSAFLVCGLWAAVLWTTARRTASRAQWSAVTAVAVVLVVASAWAMVSWGSFGEHVPLLNTVLPSRAAQTVGYPAAILVCLVLSRLEEGRPRLALGAAVVCAAVTAYGVSSLQSALPSLGALEVWATVAVVGVLVWCVTRWPSRVVPVAAVIGTLVLAGYDANPVLFGLGDLRGSPAAARAEAFGHRAEAAGDRWAADSLGGSALLVANGVPTVTGYQVTGPDVSRWGQAGSGPRLRGRVESRGRFLLMGFQMPEGSPADGPPVVTNPSPDVIQVYIDPCQLAQTDLDVAHLLAVRPVDSPCAKQVATFLWNGQQQYAYELSARAA